MILCQNRKVKKGIYGEEQLLRWFQEYKIGFIPINQTPHTFARAFSNTIKRPDFFVLLPSIGIIAVDVKNYKCNANCFTVSEKEIQKALRFEMVTRMPFWFVYLYNDGSVVEWCWINVLKAAKTGLVRKNSITQEKFFVIDLELFTRVTDGANLGRIFSCQCE